jgi:hypothetical protein
VTNGSFVNAGARGSLLTRPMADETSCVSRVVGPIATPGTRFHGATTTTTPAPRSQGTPGGRYATGLVLRKLIPHFIPSIVSKNLLRAL